MVGVDDIRAGRWSFALAVLLVVAACDSPPAAGTSDASDRASAASNSQLQLKVVTGGDLPDEPDRIVALGPNVVETVFALGAGERVVAVTKFADHPERATELPSVGSYVQPDFESIVSREPDLVVGVTSGGDPEIADKLEAAGVPFAFVEMSTFEQTRAAIRRIGEWIGRPDRADELVGRIDREVEAVQRAFAPESGDGPRVLMVRGRAPIVAAGPGSLGAAFIERAGARNVLSGSDTSHPRLDTEKVIELAPEVIVDTTLPSATSSSTFWQDLESVPAVENGRVRRVTTSAALRAGPRIGEGLRAVAEAIYGR